MKGKKSPGDDMISTGDYNNGKADRKRFYRYLLICAIFCMVIAFFSFIPFIRQGNGAFTLRDDFNAQQLPFNIYMNGFLKNSLPGEWCWSLDAGCSFVQGFSFYGLGSPFTWLSFLLPGKAFPYAVGWFYILKYIAAGISAYIYFHVMTEKSGWPEVFGAILYAFSGFQAANLLFFHFHDIVALFPLMLIGIERLMKGKGYLLFSLSVFINCICNYYFFIGEVIFLIIYYLFRFCGRGSNFFKGIFKCLFAGVLGVGMACVLFLPSIIYILGNPRSMNHLSWSKHLLPDLEQVLYLLKGILLPGDTMHDQTAVISTKWSSTACWLPMCGCSLPFAYVMKKRDRLSAMLVFLTAISFSPFLSSTFVFFTQDYQRWWYMLILLSALAAVLVLNNPEAFPVKRAVFLNLLLILGYYAFVQHLNSRAAAEEPLVFHPVRFKMFIAIAAAGLLLLFLIRCIYPFHKKVACLMLITCVSVSACGTTLFTIYSYRQNEESTEQVMTLFEAAEQLEDFDQQYRYECEYWWNCFPLAGNVAGVGSFSSTTANSRFEFADLFEYDNAVRSLNKSMYTGLSELFGAKYIINTIPEPDKSIVKKFNVRKGDWYVLERPACPLGYKADKYILRDDLMKIRKKKRGIALLHAPVIEKTDEDLVKDAAGRTSKEEINFKEDLSDTINGIIGRKVDAFERDSRGFRCSTNYSEDSLVFFTVPYDPGWEAAIDGKKAELIDSGGLILIKVPAGDHKISFTYRTPGLSAGIIVSAFSFLVFAVLALYGLRKKRPGKTG